MLDRKNYESAIPQLEKKIGEIESGQKESGINYDAFRKKTEKELKVVRSGIVDNNALILEERERAIGVEETKADQTDLDDLSENLNGVTTYQYTTGGTTYNVYIDGETGSYYYIDDEDERVPIAEDDLDVDSDGDPITNIEGGSVNELSRNVEQIGEDLTDNVQTINKDLLEIRDVAIQSLINQNYATIEEDGNLRIYNAQDNNTYMVLTSVLLAFMKGDTEIASVINYEDEGTFKADNAIISTLRMRNAESGVGEFAWVQSETGHLSLKKA